MLKEALRILVAGCLMLAMVALIVVTGEHDPAYMVMKTTWDGQPAYGQLHRDGSYTFFHWTPNPEFGLTEITTLPAAEAAKLH